MQPLDPTATMGTPNARNALFKRAAARAAAQLQGGQQISPATLARLRSGYRGGKGLKFTVGPAQLDQSAQDRLAFLRKIAGLGA